MRRRRQGAWGRRGGTAGSQGDVKQGDPRRGESGAGDRARVCDGALCGRFRDPVSQPGRSRSRAGARARLGRGSRIGRGIGCEPSCSNAAASAAGASRTTIIDNGQTPSSKNWGCSRWSQPMFRSASPDVGHNLQLEIRMREIRPSGSEGGEESILFPYPYPGEDQRTGDDCLGGSPSPATEGARFKRMVRRRRAKQLPQNRPRRSALVLSGRPSILTPD